MSRHLHDPASVWHMPGTSKLSARCQAFGLLRQNGPCHGNTQLNFSLRGGKVKFQGQAASSHPSPATEAAAGSSPSPGRPALCSQRLLSKGLQSKNFLNFLNFLRAACWEGQPLVLDHRELLADHGLSAMAHRHGTPVLQSFPFRKARLVDYLTLYCSKSKKGSAHLLP